MKGFSCPGNGFFRRWRRREQDDSDFAANIVRGKKKTDGVDHLRRPTSLPQAGMKN
jgi:hypothetical protein